MKERLPGATIEIDTPLGTKIPMRFGGDGLVSGEAGILGSYLGSAKDRGRWWVDGDRLCIKWFRWFESQQRCMDINVDGSRVLWRKEDGESGTATLAEAPQPPPIKSAEAKAAAPAATPPGHEAKPVSEVTGPAPAAPVPAAIPAPPQAAPLGAGTSAPAEPQTAAAAPSIVEQAAAIAARFANPPDAKTAALETQRMSVGAITTEPVILNPTPDAPVAESSSGAEVDAPPASGASSEPATAAAMPADPIETAAAPTVPREAAAPAQAPRTPSAAIKPKGTAPNPPRTERKAAATRDPTFRVARVAADDMLNIRSGPSEYTSVVGIISPSGSGVRMTGDCRGDWCPIRHGATTGWVNRYYLSEDPAR